MIEVLTPLSAQIQLIHFRNDLHNFTAKEVQDKKQPPQQKKKRKKERGRSPASGWERLQMRLDLEWPKS